MSGISLNQFGLIARLKSPRGLIAIAVVGLGLAGGYYYFMNSSPQLAGAMTAPSGNSLKQSAIRRGASTRPAAAVAPQAVAPLANTPAITAPQADPLGSIYFDKGNGFSIRFPLDWSIQTFPADPWVLDAGDPGSGMISIGFTPCPTSVKADQLLPESIARRIKKTPGTTLTGQGKTVIAGHTALWFKSTGPLPMTNGLPIMTRVQYIVALGDGRIMEIRVAAPPSQFNAMTYLMKQSVDTFCLIPRK